MDQRLHDEFINHVHVLTAIKSFETSSTKGADAHKTDDITDVFRWLRNNSPQLCANTKDKLLKLKFDDTCHWFCDHYFNNKSLSFSIILQFLANWSMNHKPSQQSIFHGFHNGLRRIILEINDSKLLNNSIMLLYNLSLNNTNLRTTILEDIDLMQKIIDHWVQNELEFSKIFLDSIFSNSKDFLSVYTHYPDSSKRCLMNLLCIWLNDFEDDVSIEVITTIIDNFFIDCTIEEISNITVELLAKASSIEKFNSEIKKSTTLLTKLMDLLIDVHERSKNSNDSNNEFSCVKNLSALFNNSDVQTSVRFGFKSDIIRLIANMCYNHQQHQNLMRNKNIIPILLECCSFDAKNPLMREWSLYALRNIMEGNMNNQNFVANIDSVQIDSSDPESSVMLTDTLGMATIQNSNFISDTDFI